MDRVGKVRRALLAAGHEDSIAEFPEGTHSAADAAAAIGCSVAQIAKSIVFRAGEDVILVVASGTHRIDRNKVAAAVGQPIKTAEAAWVQSKTGFAVGGVAPIRKTVTRVEPAVPHSDGATLTEEGSEHAHRRGPGAHDQRVPVR